MQYVGLVARFQCFLYEIRVVSTKRNFKYLQGTIEYGQWYANIKELKSRSYIDVDLAPSLDGKKRTSGALSSWGNAWCHGSARNKTPILYQVLKQGILMLLTIACKCYG